eukprot:scaffold4760_cov113-Isochrysis_galbana.AAC.8
MDIGVALRWEAEAGVLSAQLGARECDRGREGEGGGGGGQRRADHAGMCDQARPAHAGFIAA